MSASGASLADFERVNRCWYESLDQESGQYYYVNTADNNTAAWEAPEHFMNRRELVDRICELEAAAKDDDPGFQLGHAVADAVSVNRVIGSCNFSCALGSHRHR